MRLTHLPLDQNIGCPSVKWLVVLIFITCHKKSGCSPLPFMWVCLEIKDLTAPKRLLLVHHCVPSESDHFAGYTAYWYTGIHLNPSTVNSHFVWVNPPSLGVFWMVRANPSRVKQGRNPSRASRVFQRETSLKPAFRTCFENAPSKRGLRRNFFFYSFHRAYMDFKALHRCETHCIFSWDRHCQLRMYSINLGLICLLHFPVLFKLSGIHFLILFQVASAFCVPAILLALQGFRFKRLVNSFSTCRTETLRWPCRFAMDGQAFAPSLYTTSAEIV